MQQKGELDLLIVSTIVIIVIVVFLIILFTVFQSRKNLILLEKENEKKRFEREIAESQIEIREETLRNISWELHDNIGQLLTLAKIQIQHASPENMHDITETISKSLNEIRALSRLINPEFIKNINLKNAIQLEVERFNRLNYIEASLQVLGDEVEVNKKHSIIIFRILQEFFSNTIKHSKATELKVLLNYKKDELVIIAEDNGIGFDMEKTKSKGIGLQNMKTRATLINADIYYDSKLDQGTLLKINYYL